MYRSKFSIYVLVCILALGIFYKDKITGAFKQVYDRIEQMDKEAEEKKTPSIVGIVCKASLRGRIEGKVLESTMLFDYQKQDVIIEDGYNEGTTKEGYIKERFLSPMTCQVYPTRCDSLFGSSYPKYVDMCDLIEGFENNETYKAALNRDTGEMKNKSVAITIDSEYLEEARFLFIQALYPEKAEDIANGGHLTKEQEERINAIIEKAEITEYADDYFRDSKNRNKILIAPEYKCANQRPIYIYDGLCVDFTVWYKEGINNLGKVIDSPQFSNMLIIRRDGMERFMEYNFNYSAWDITYLHNSDVLNKN